MELASKRIAGAKWLADFGEETVLIRSFHSAGPIRRYGRCSGRPRLAPEKLLAFAAPHNDIPPRHSRIA
jgi:hypothetical protein